MHIPNTERADDMQRLTEERMSLLLDLGAGIMIQNETEIWIDRNFSVSGINFKQKQKASFLMKTLAERICHDQGLWCDFITVFEERPAVTELALLLAVEVGMILQRPVGVLVISREKSAALFRYCVPGLLEGEPDQWHDLETLAADDAKELLENRRTILFTDVLRGNRHEGIVRIFYHRAVRRAGVTIACVSACLIRIGAIRFLMDRLPAGRQVPVVYLQHMRNLRKHGAETPQERTERRQLFAGFGRFWHRFVSSTQRAAI